MVRIFPFQARRRGTSIPEAAIVIGLCLLILFGIYEYGRFLMMKTLLDNAAREASRFAVVHTADKTTSDVQNRALNYLAGQGTQLQSLAVQVFESDSNGNNIGNWTDAQFGQYIAVQINGTYRPVTPTLLFLPSTIPLQARSVMYSEAN
jgi:Flp pilus assembly protein TadG